MARIKIQDYIKDVELNRQRLVNATNSDNNSSLSDVVSSALSKIKDDVELDEKLHEVRFFDADGTLLKTEWVKDGGTCAPPPNPTYDSEYLTFVRWASAIGERFDNITHDVDYGTIYSINDRSIHIFCEFKTEAQLSISLRIKIASRPSDATLYIDWGDGSNLDTFTASSLFSHTYNSIGEYEIHVYSNYDLKSPQEMWSPSSPTIDKFKYYLNCTSDNWGGYYLGNADKDSCIKKLYTPIYYNQYSTSSIIPICVYESICSANSYSSAGKICIFNNILHDTAYYYGESGYGIGSYGQFITFYAPYAIIDTSFVTASNGCFIGCSYCYADAKLIIPEHAYLENIQYIYAPLKLISLSEKYNANGCSTCNKLTHFIIKKPIKTDVKALPQSAYCLKEVELDISSLSGTYIDSPLIDTITVPTHWTITNVNAFNLQHLKNLILPVNFDTNLNLSNCYLDIDCIVDILNKIKPNVTDRTIKFNSNLLKYKLPLIYVTLSNSLVYAICDKNATNAISIIEAFANKGWTIS